jgi:hypothetical protein
VIVEDDEGLDETVDELVGCRVTVFVLFSLIVGIWEG